jgi:hypothetical protein
MNLPANKKQIEKEKRLLELTHKELNSRVDVARKLKPMQTLFLLTLPKYHFNATMTCQVLEIPWSTYSLWLKENTYFQEQLEIVKDAMFHKAEEIINKELEKGNMEAVKLLLKYKGKKHKYNEETKIDINHSGSIQIIPINIIAPEPTINIDNINGD